MPRITVETDEALLEEARRVLGVHTKREAIERALQELVRQQRRRAIRVHAG
ncbi:type II toxin-antitoxin system VapB family antitoxin [Calidithermus chliarophilus]|uniref:type II toxin-antitoxin system VapB family antitoxin n=1 Tax=Calidithermus chliarophilus TaxID=52023 RepID=UPI000425A2DF|nr:type II toxin-antitoxin system VapB family antitoxin [Calidithermus chliarophilus]